jgi:hypothetical protein
MHRTSRNPTLLENRTNEAKKRKTKNHGPKTGAAKTQFKFKFENVRFANLNLKPPLCAEMLFVTFGLRFDAWRRHFVLRSAVFKFKFEAARDLVGELCVQRRAFYLYFLCLCGLSMYSLNEII